MANRNKSNPGKQPNQTGSQSGNPRNQDLQRGQQQGIHAAQSQRTSSSNKLKPDRRDNASK